MLKQAMKRSGFAGEQIIGILKKDQARTPLMEFGRTDSSVFMRRIIRDQILEIVLRSSDAR
jgi:hypothetical protein